MSDIAHWYAYVDLNSRYGFGMDVEGGKEVAGLFTPDGVWDASDLGYGLLEGRDALHGYFGGDEGRADGMAHLFANPQVLSVEGDTMRARAYVQGIVARAGKDVVRHDVVVYDDELVRVDGDWKFKRRTLKRVVDFRTTRPVR